MCNARKSVKYDWRLVGLLFLVFTMRLFIMCQEGFNLLASWNRRYIRMVWKLATWSIEGWWSSSYLHLLCSRSSVSLPTGFIRSFADWTGVCWAKMRLLFDDDEIFNHFKPLINPWLLYLHYRSHISFCFPQKVPNFSNFSGHMRRKDIQYAASKRRTGSLLVCWDFLHPFFLGWM